MTTYAGTILGPYGTQSIAFLTRSGHILGWVGDSNDPETERLPLRGAWQDDVIGFHVYDPPLRITYRGLSSEESGLITLSGDESEAGQWAGEVQQVDLPKEQVLELREVASRADPDDLEVPGATDGEPGSETQAGEEATADASETDGAREERIARLRERFEQHQEELRKRRQAEQAARDEERAAREDRLRQKKEHAAKARQRAAKAKKAAAAGSDPELTRALIPGGGISSALLERLMKQRRQQRRPRRRGPVVVARPTRGGGGSSAATGSIRVTAAGSRAEQSSMFTVFVSSPALDDGGRSARFTDGHARVDKLPAGTYRVSLDSKADMAWSPQPRVTDVTLGEGQSHTLSVTF